LGKVAAGVLLARQKRWAEATGCRWPPYSNGENNAHGQGHED